MALPYSFLWWGFGMVLSVILQKKIKRFFACVVCSFVLGFLLCGCASYRVKPLRKLTKETAQYTQEKNNIQVCAARLDKQEFKEYTQGVVFLKKSQLVPILITIYNTSSYPIVLDTREVLLPLVIAEKAIDSINYTNIGGAFSALGISLLGMGGIGFALLTTAHGCAGMGQGLLGLGMWFAALPASIIIAACVGHRDRVVFKELLLSDLREKILSKVELLKGESISKLIITRREYLERSFVLRVKRGIDVSGKMVEFNVFLSEAPCV